MNHPHQHIIQFLAALKSERFAIGVDSHLIVWKILQSLPSKADEQTVRDYLSPIFCTSEQEQDKFKTVFSKYYHLLALENDIEEKDIISNDTSQNDNTTKPNFRKYLLGSILIATILAVFGIGLYQYLQPPPPIVGCMDKNALNYNPLAEIDDGSCQYQDTLYVCFDSTMLNYVDTLGRNSRTTLYLPCDSCCYCAGCTNRNAINYNPKACEDDGSCEFPEPTTPIEKARKDSTTYKVPFEKRPVDLPDLQPINNRWDYKLYQAKTPISIALYLLLLGLFIARVLYQRKRKSYNATRQKGEEPPYTLPIKITNDKGILFEEEMQLVLRDMRGRENSHLNQLNLSKTIAATIKKGGLLQAQYQFRTRPTEYLILIDKNTDQNHQSQLFEHIYQLIKEEEVIATRFFFDDDPRICWNDQYPSGIAIERLAHIYDEARLMIFSDGHSFINPTNNQTEKWLQPLEHWKRRALMTPQPMAGWNYREGILAQFFMVLPSSIEGLTEVVEHIETLKESDLRAWKYEIGKTDQPIEINKTDLIPSLRTHFDTEMMRWIVACAVYPELHWDLTIRIGHALSEDNQTLVTHKNIIQLARLKWFQRGYMPSDVRQTLLEFTDFTDADRQKVRDAIITVLEENIPTNTNSYAFEEHQMHLAINHLLLNKVGEDRKKWLQLYQEQYDKGIKEDIVAIQEQQKQNNFLGFKLSENFAASIFKDGRAFLGVQSWLALGRLLVGLFVGLLIVFGFQFFWKVKCFDEPVRIGNSENLYCLNSAQDTVDFAILRIMRDIDFYLENGRLMKLERFEWRYTFRHLYNIEEDLSWLLDDNDTSNLDFLDEDTLMNNKLLEEFYKPIIVYYYNKIVDTYGKNEFHGMNLRFHPVVDVINKLGDRDNELEYEAILVNIDIIQLYGLIAHYSNKKEYPKFLNYLKSYYANETVRFYIRKNVPNLYHFQKYDFVDSMVENRVRVRKDGKYGFLDSLGLPTWEGVLPPYNYAINYSDGKTVITKGSEQCLIDKSGNQIGDCFTKLIASQDPISKLWGYKNERNVWIILPEYEETRDFETDYAITRKNGKYGMIDKSNNISLPFDYDFIGNFQKDNKTTIIKKGNLFGFINSNLTLKIEPIYQDAANFTGKNNPQAIVKLNDKTFTINIANECVENCLFKVEGIVSNTKGEKLNNVKIITEFGTTTTDNQGKYELKLYLNSTDKSSNLKIIAYQYQNYFAVKNVKLKPTIKVNFISNFNPRTNKIYDLNQVNIPETTNLDLRIEGYSLNIEEQGLYHTYLDIYSNTAISQNLPNNQRVSTLLGYFFSLDNVFDENDILLGNDRVSFYSNKLTDTESEKVIIPPLPKAGDYYIIIVADYNLAVNDPNRQNNIQPMSLNLKGSSQNIMSSGERDLYPLNIQLSHLKIAPDGFLSVLVDQNYNGTDENSIKSNLGYFLSKDNRLSSDDKLLGTDISSLSKRDLSDRESTQVKIPIDLKYGEYYIIVKADYLNVLHEVNEENNEISMKFEIGEEEVLNKEYTVPNSGMYITPKSISGVIIDSKTLEPIEEVMIELDNSKLKGYTDSEGKFNIKLNSVGYPLYNLTLSKENYFTKKTSQSPKNVEKLILKLEKK